MTTTAAKKPRGRKPKAVVVIPDESQIHVPTPVVEDLPVEVEVEPTPAKRDWFVIRYLPENVGTPANRKKAWDAELELLYGMIEGQDSKPLTTEKLVGDVMVGYILGQQELIDFLTEKYPSYVADGCPKYEFPKE